MILPLNYFQALTGDVIVSRCQRSRSLLEQSLLQIQNNVPVALAVEGATFILDPYEEEAGKVVKELLHVGESASDSQESSEIKALQLAASRLHITSSKAILIEKRSIRNCTPEEFKCPISSRLMYDPVVIASGQTYERMWIQKWIDEGHNTCPKTNMKLTHLLLTPNMVMKDLISSWCTKYGVTISDPSVPPEALHFWETSSTSIASIGSSMNDLHLQMDLSNVSLGSIDSTYSLDSLRTKTVNGLSSVQSNGDSDRCQSDANMCKPD
ncbi:hypothetical protein FNV43_RR18965 [Rhamnella rubrinervis]|uniref:RING-type E3 ubiquitin transferase n=1 Tax=Rhamnella rubrinervis TaxID=2594499 RepID=A0A8K0GWI8_9ROSA|nr:hypothetical protein FNV43_RR18965 [Rhamnella rubrinervis]